MADITQSAKQTIISHQAVTNPESVEGTELALTDGTLSVTIILKHAYIEAVDPGGDEPTFHIMVSQDASGDESWGRKLSIKMKDPGATVATEAMTATEPIAETVLAVASTTGFAAGDEIYVQDTTTEADSEWHLVDRIVSNTSVDIFYGLTNQKDSADVLWGSAETHTITLNCEGIKRVNVLYSNEGASGTPANTAVLVEAIMATDFE